MPGDFEQEKVQASEMQWFVIDNIANHTFSLQKGLQEMDQEVMTDYAVFYK